MDASLPVLVTRLPDRRALARLVRAALRHEVAQVQLAEGPRKAQPHTLDLRVSGSPPVSLIAEPAGAGQNGQFPLRLRPLHRAQAAELYALLEAENVSSEPSPQREAEPKTTDPMVASRVIQPSDVSAPIARAMSGSAPPPVAEARASVPHGLPADPKRTAPSASWNPPPKSAPPSAALRGSGPPSAGPQASSGSAPPATVATPGGHAWANDDPKRTRPSASWNPPPEPAPEVHAADAPDGTLSVSVVFEPEEAQAILAPRPPSSPADEEGPSLSVSVVFEPDVDPGGVPSPNESPASGEGFFDDALANLPPVEFDDALANLPPLQLDEAVIEVAGAPTAAPTTPMEQAEVLSRRDVDLVEGSLPPAIEDDDDAETLIRLPSQNAGQPNARAAPRPAAGAPALRPATVPPVSNTLAAAAPPVRLERPQLEREEHTLTPTANSPTAQPTSSKRGTGHGRKKKTTRHGKGERKKKSQTGHTPVFAADELGTAKRRSDAGTDPLLGRRIADGKYLIESAIGAGAAGAVYRGVHRELRRQVAIKVLHPHYQEDEHFMKSFKAEARAASQLDHPNVMRVLDFGQEPDGLLYIVMELLTGRTLQSLLDEERRLPTDRACEIMIQVCAALSVAHDNGIIHRDIKPDNIMLVPSRNDEGGTFELVKVCDFGIAALQNPRGDDAELNMAEGIIAGTPEYMSPEQARGNDIDARSDVYACGICLYELVTGRPPFLGENAAEILVKQLEEVPKPPSQIVKGLDPLLEEIILRAVQKDPAKRHQSARELRVELKELLDEGEGRDEDEDDERSIVENVPGLDDPASGFPGFFLLFSSAVLRFGRFERGHPEAPQATKDFLKSTRAALRGRRELTFARRDSQKSIGFCVMTGHSEIVDLKRLLGSQLFGSHGVPFIETLVKKGIAALTIREGIPEMEIQYLIEMLLGPHAHEDLRKELLTKPLRHISVIFVADVVGRDRKLTWKVGLCASRLARDLRALSNVRGISLKKMREIREDLITGVARLLTKGDEVRQFLFNADLVDEAVANLRGFSSFQVAPPMVDALLHIACAEAAILLAQDFDEGKINREVLRGYIKMFAARMAQAGERSDQSDHALSELYRRHIIGDDDMPRDLRETIRASTLADALVRDPSQFLRMLEFIQDPEDYARELGTLEAAMAVLARKAEAGALLAAVSVLARHAKGGGGSKPGPRADAAYRTMKSMIDKQRLLPIANALLVGPPHQREAARQLLVLAGSAGAQALYIAREGLTDPNGRPMFVKVFRETGPAGWAILSNVLPRIEVANDQDIGFVEDLLRAMPDRHDPVLGDAVAKFLAHPRLRPTALMAIVPLWGERARKPLLDALEFAEEPARIVAVTELRRMRGIDEHVVGVIERLLTMRGSASDELRAAAAAALGDVAANSRARALALLTKGVEGKRGFVAMLRGDGGSDESIIVTESMARALLQLDRNEGVRAIKSRVSKADGILKQRLTALLQS